MRKISYVMLMTTVLALPVVFSTGCAIGTGRSTVGEYADDKSIASRIKTNLYRDPVVKGNQVDVTSLRGNVQLSGFVETSEAKERAGQIAASTPGVTTLHNDLIVIPPGQATPTGR